jgi:hypothetical protein
MPPGYERRAKRLQFLLVLAAVLLCALPIIHTLTGPQ